jgi:hypothetical protein
MALERSVGTITLNTPGFDQSRVLFTKSALCSEKQDVLQQSLE